MSYEPGQPLTAEDLEELGDGGPWEDDDEYTQFLVDLLRLRRD